MSGAREEILAKVRENLLAAHAEEGEPREIGNDSFDLGAPLGLEEAEGRLALFRSNLDRVGAHCHSAANEDQARTILAGILQAAGTERMAVSDAEVVARLSHGLAGVELVDSRAERSALLDAELGLTSAQWGIAETGTLVLVSESERHRLASLLPPIHVALLRRSAILGSLGQALERLRGDDVAAISRALTFITGPSRTGDIELTLVVGVHGPKELHVILIP